MLKGEYARTYAFEAWYWWFVGRRALVNRALAPLLAGGQARTLDVGCGTGYHLDWLGHRSLAYGVDLAAEALGLCRERGLPRLVQGRAERLAFADASFDVLVALDVLEHLPDDAAALLDWRRVLVPGGHLVLFVPAFESLWSGEDYVSQHERRYRRGLLAARLREAGFDIIRLTYANTALLLPMAATILWRRVFRPRSSYRSNLTSLPSWLNGLLTRIFSLEARLLDRWNSPVGSSLLCVARKPASAVSQPEVAAFGRPTEGTDSGARA